MSRPSNTPKHRATSDTPRPAQADPHSSKHAARRVRGHGPLGKGRRLTRTTVLPAIAVTVTAGAVLTGTLVASEAGTGPSTQALVASFNGDVDRPVDSDVIDELEREREKSLSRSDRRTDVDPAKLELLSQETDSGGQVTRSEDLGSGDPRVIAQALLPEFGFSSDQFSCLDSLWTKESGWNVYADNPSSSAYGIPQALPGSKMASAGPDWADNPATQIRWGLGYIAERYGSPCGAWGHSQSNGWY